MRFAKGLVLLVLVLVALSCDRDPFAKLEGKYDELRVLVTRQRQNPSLAVKEAKEWFLRSQPEFEKLCAQIGLKSKRDPDRALGSSLRQMRKFKEVQQALDVSIETWEAADRVELSALLVELAQVCLPASQKLTPMRSGS